MNYLDYYQILGLGRDASQEAITKAYRKLARKHHPDVAKESGSEKRFHEINEAYEVLGDAEKRKQYDQYGAAWKQVRSGGAVPPGFEGFQFDFGAAEGGQAGGGFSSFFDMLFGAGGGVRGGRGGGFRMPGADVEARLTLRLEEAARGGRRQISLAEPGSGRTRTVDVRIPAGVRAGQRIRLSRQGSPGPAGGPPGDLYLLVDFQPHPEFRIEDRDLHVELAVTPWEAALGGSATVSTLDGPVRVKIPAGSSSGRKIRLRGKGFPDPRGASGDLYAEIRIVVPESLTPEETELFQRLAAISDFGPKGRGVASEAREAEKA